LKEKSVKKSNFNHIDVSNATCLPDIHDSPLLKAQRRYTNEHKKSPNKKAINLLEIVEETRENIKECRTGELMKIENHA